MSRSLNYIFPPGDTEAVSKVQSMAAAGNLILNGNLSNSINSQVSFIDQGYSRSISITSTANLTARTITIRGIQNGVPIVEDIVGPNNTTVYAGAPQIYDQINSISIDGPATNISIGTGWSGFFRLIGINLEKDILNYTLTISKIEADVSIPFIVAGTIENIFNNNKTITENIASENTFIIKGVGTEDQYIYTSTGNPTYSTLIVYLGTDATSIALNMQLNFIQV